MSSKHNWTIGGHVYQLTTLAPVRPGHERALTAELHRIDQLPSSPFTRLPRTHFARLVLVPQIGADTDREHKRMLEPVRFLFGAAFDGPPVAYLEDVARTVPDLVSGLWGHCDGCP